VSIVTKTGDRGTTAVMYGRRMMKCHPRIEACGEVDELNSALGLARATAEEPRVSEILLPIQKDLVVLMGELAVAPEDLERYAREGFSLVSPEMTSRLETEITGLEAGEHRLQDWATPGAGLSAATLDLARTVCRRAERRVCALQQEGQLGNGRVIVYLNRLADLLWLLARFAEIPARGGTG
jgi:cob(I)alamin adenosyltransferase